MVVMADSLPALGREEEEAAPERLRERWSAGLSLGQPFGGRSSLGRIILAGVEDQ